MKKNFFFCLFIYFWLHRVFVAARRFFSSGGEQGYSLVVYGLLIAVASLVEHRFLALRLQYLQHAGSVIVACRL